MQAKRTTSKQAAAPARIATEARQVLLSERAIAQRVNRSLAKRGLKLCKAKGRPAADLGEWYVVDNDKGEVVARNVQLAEIANQEGALQPYEAIEAAEESTRRYHPVIGYMNGETLRLAGGLTYAQAIAAAHAVAENTEHDEEIDFIGAAIDRA